MCMQDLWIGKHTIANRLSASTTDFTLTPSQNRLAIVAGGAAGVVLYSEKSVELVRVVFGAIPYAWSYTESGGPLPAAVLGQTTVTAASQDYPTIRFDLREYGQAIQGACRILSLSGSFAVHELIADSLLARRLSAMEVESGWPWGNL